MYQNILKGKKVFTILNVLTWTIYLYTIASRLIAIYEQEMRLCNKSKNKRGNFLLPVIIFLSCTRCLLLVCILRLSFFKLSTYHTSHEQPTPKKNSLLTPFMSVYGVWHKMPQFRNTSRKEARRGEKSMMLPRVLDNFLRAFSSAFRERYKLLLLAVPFIDFTRGVKILWNDTD